MKLLNDILTGLCMLDKPERMEYLDKFETYFQKGIYADVFKTISVLTMLDEEITSYTICKALKESGKTNLSEKYYEIACTADRAEMVKQNDKILTGANPYIFDRSEFDNTNYAAMLDGYLQELHTLYLMRTAI